MQRGETGVYEVTTVAGEQVRAFVPNPLPPAPPLALDGPIHQTLERAVLAEGRLDGVSAHLPDNQKAYIPAAGGTSSESAWL